MSDLLGIPSLPITIFITYLQILQLLIFTEKRALNFFYFISIFLLILFCIYNKATLATVNILLTIILIKNISLKRVILASVVSEIIIAFLIFSMLGVGYLNDEIRVMPKGIAHTFGFSNSNAASAFFFNIFVLLSLFILCFFRYKFPVFLMIIPCYMVYKITLGRTHFFSLLILFFFLLIFYFKVFQNNFKKIYISVPILLYIITIVFLKIYEIFPILDVLFTTRFSKNAKYFNDCRIINYLIGYKLPSGEPMDSAYLAQFFAGGLLSVYIFLSIYIKGIMYSDRKFIKKYLPFIFCMIISGFAENTFSSFSLITLVFYKLLISQSFNKSGLSKIYEQKNTRYTKT